MVSRGAGRSAVAAAAYLSCSRMLNDYDGVQHDYTRKQGLAWQAVFLPPMAPPEWQDREKLWNAVEEAEKTVELYWGGTYVEASSSAGTLTPAHFEDGALVVGISASFTLEQMILVTGLELDETVYPDGGKLYKMSQTAARLKLKSVTLSNGEAGDPEEVLPQATFPEIQWVSGSTDTAIINADNGVITVKNEGEVPGYVKEIYDYLPTQLDFKTNGNTGWKMQGTKIVNTTLEDQIINPGEEKEVRLTLSKQLNQAEMGTIINTAEIGLDYNSNSILDRDSTSNNQNQNEDDISSAILIISVKTGRTIIYISLILVTILILGLGIYFIKAKVLR